MPVVPLPMVQKAVLFCFLMIALTGIFARSSVAREMEVRSQIRNATRVYVTYRQNRMYQDSWNMFTSSTQEVLPLHEYVAIQYKYRTKMGGLDVFRVLRIARDQETDLYILDFSALYDKDFYECGYFVWQMQDDGGLRLKRVQRGLLSFEAINGPDGPALIEQLKCNLHDLPPRGLPHS